MRLKIEGQKNLNGEVKISGAKNSALPAIAASLLTNEIKLKNIPFVQDILSMKELLNALGSKLEIDDKNNTLFIKNKSISSLEAPYECVKRMRASILILGPLLAKFGEVRVAYPGGCKIGPRPVDLHLENLKKMGAEIEVKHGTIIAKAKKLNGANIIFDKVTVTGTENIIMAATLAKGTTVIENAAKEPEVLDLIKLLKKMKAKIKGEGTDTIRIKGVKKLKPVEYSIIPDRIEAGTYLIIGALIANHLIIKNLNTYHIKNIISKLEETGIRFKKKSNYIEVMKKDKLKPVDVETQPFPGFPTDMQAQFMVMLTQAEGRSIVKDTIFPGRFHHMDELLRLGADIKKLGNGEVSIRGKTPLSGAEVTATDLRASASLVIAGLIASGTTIINDIFHLERGYENFVDKIKNIGGNIEKIN